MPNTVPLSSIPASERRFLAVISPATATQLEQRPRPTGWQDLIVPAIAMSVAGGGALWLLSLPQLNKAKSPSTQQIDGSVVLTVSHADVASMSFPIGHPRDRSVYALHPVEEDIYVPLSDFHRTVFEHKVAEALRLVRSLGATTIGVEHVSGWQDEKAAGAKLVVPTATPVDVGLDTSSSRNSSRHVITEFKLRPNNRVVLPTRLVWYRHEPLWVEVAEARLESGLSSFSIDVSYTDDYGVNASLKAGIEGLGLSVDGHFREHTSTVWRLSGKFGGD